MKFVYQPILEKMIQVYQNPRTIEGRFDNYLKVIQGGNKKDMTFPLPFFNPMAKEHVLEKLLKLKVMNFETLMVEFCYLYSTIGQEINMYFNLADDISGGWTTKESTHEISLKINPFLKRNLGVLVFYSSEKITLELIKDRVKFYCDYYNSFNKTKTTKS
jgi:hypothetical protein